MTTASTNTTIAQTSTATFDAWINEVYTNLVTNCGLTQTTDTGQMAVPSVTAVPGAGSTSAGYYVFKFNDTLQATAPIFIKLEFGSGTAAANPQMWITVGTGSNGSGTINGTVMTRVAVCSGTAVGSTITNYVSRYCYNATQGFLGLVFKIGSIAANEAQGGFCIFRSVNSAGNPTADSVMLITNSNTATGGNNGGVIQVLSYNLSAAYLSSGPIPASINAWGFVPFTSTATLEGTAGQIFPVFQWAGSSSVPGYGITNALAIGLLPEESVGSSITVTVLGSVSLTYISVGCPFGSNAITGFTVGTYTLLMLWQ